MALAERAVDRIKRLSYLVVDDITSMRATLKKMLRIMGIKDVKDAPGTEKALDILKNTRIDFIISDWNMPDLSGIEFLHKLKDNPQTKDIPFLMISGEVEEKQIIRAAESEIDGYIIKPFYTQTLEDKIVSILERREKPSPFDGHLRIAQVFLESRQHEKAITECEQALLLNPNSSRVRDMLGKIYLKMGAVEKAEAVIKEAIEINPMYLRSYETLANHYLESNKEDQALPLLEKASEVSPNNPKRQVSMGQIYLKKNRLDKARTAFKVAEKFTESLHVQELATQIGEAYLVHGFNQEAVEVFQSLLNIDGRDLNAFNKIGIALRKQGRHQDAIQQYQRALQVDNTDEVLHFNIARAYHEAGYWHEAQQHLDRALEILPSFKEAKAYLEKLQ